MLRLAVIGSPESPWTEVARRLRDVALEPIRDAGALEDDLQRWDAIVLFPNAGEVALDRLLKAGRHLLLVASLCPDPIRLRALGERAGQAKVRFAIANLDRYLPSRQLLRQQLEAGKLGRPGLVRLHRWEAAIEEGGAGALVADLQAVIELYGTTPDRIYALEHSSLDAPRRAGLLVHLGFPGGGMALIDHGHRLPPGDGYTSLSVIGSSGAAYADDQANMQLLFRGGPARAVRSSEGLLSLVGLVSDFAASIAAKRESAPDLAGWFEALAVAEAVERSLRTRKAVGVEERAP